MKKLKATSHAVIKRVRAALEARRPNNEHRCVDEFYFGESLQYGLHVKVTEIRADNYHPIYVVREDKDGGCVLSPDYPDGETDFPAIPLKASDAINGPIYWPVPIEVVDRIAGQAMRLTEEALA